LVTIRAERQQDISAIRIVNQKAFGQPQEAQLVDALRSSHAILLSLVAVLEDQVVGYVLYTPVSVVSGQTTLVGAGLGPLAVLPGYQRQGFGGKLIESGNRRLQEAGCPFIVVLGHSSYYPRFGFKPASLFGFRCEWEVPDEAFMMIIMDPEKMTGISGLARYRPEFSDLT